MHISILQYWISVLYLNVKIDLLPEIEKFEN